MDRIQEIDQLIAELKEELHAEVRFRVNEALGGRVDTDSDIDEIVNKIAELSVERGRLMSKTS